MRILVILAFLTFQSSLWAQNFRVALANIYFMGELFVDNVAKPKFGKHKVPVNRTEEKEFDRLNLEFLTRYLNYLDADILVLCETPSSQEVLEAYVDKYLDGKYEVLTNEAYVTNKKYFFNQQIAALVKKDLFQVRRYQLTKEEARYENPWNKLYPFKDKYVHTHNGKKMNIHWSRFPIEFDVALKSDPDHWYKFFVTYPKSKHSRSAKAAKKARIQNYVQQRVLRERVKAVAGDFEDIFVLGDMNDLPGKDPVEKEIGLDGIEALFLGDRDPILWNPVTFPEGQGSYIYKGKPGTIDYIFVSHGLKKGKGQVKPKIYEHFHFFKTMVRNQMRSRPDRMHNRELFLSDHAPITIDVKH